MFNNNQTTANKPVSTEAHTSYFDTITNLLNQFDDAQAAKQAARAEVTKTFLLRDTDPDTGETKVYRVTHELIATEQGTLEPLTLDSDINSDLAEGDYCH